MTIEEKYSDLLGFSTQNIKELHSLKEVALFICNYGIYGDVHVLTKSGEFVLNTYGLYINKISDMDYREALLKVLVPMQKETKKRILCGEKKETTIIRRANEYIGSEEYDNDFEAEKMKYAKSDVPPDKEIEDILINRKITEIQAELDF